MGVEYETGPTIIVGNTNPQQFTEPDFGPSLTAAGDGIPDPRKVYANTGAAYGFNYKMYGVSNHVYACLVDAAPSTFGAANICAAQTPVVPAGGATPGAVFMTLVSTSTTGVTVNCPMVPFGQAINASNVKQTLCLDMGYTTATQASTGQTTYTIPASAYRYFTVGQPIIIAGAGPSGAPLITTVMSASGTTLTVANANSTAITSLNIGNANPAIAPRDGVINASPAPLIHWPFRPGSPYPTSLIALADPTQGISRSWRAVSSNVGDTTFNVQMNGYDIDGVAMSEQIALNGTTVVYGKKAFKYILNVQLQKVGGGTPAGTISVGTSDVFGFNLRTDLYEYTNMYWNGAFLTANTGWSQALQVGPSTLSTADVRGTLQTSANGGITGATATASNGTIRLAMFISLPQYNILNATNLNASSLYGIAQFATAGVGL